MDSLIAAAARALAIGDALAALEHLGLREDPPALALRGIAMAQLEEYASARLLLRRAARRFGAREACSRARCVVAEAEVALAQRDFGGSPSRLAAAALTLATHADHVNALQARLIAVRRQLLLGRLAAAASDLAELRQRALPPALAAVAELAAAELALRSLRTSPALAALERAGRAAAASRIPSLMAEVAAVHALLSRPAARCIEAGAVRVLRLDEVETLLASDTLVVDVCRRGVRAGQLVRSLARRPVLFALAQALAERWPADVERHTLIAQAFATRRPDDSHRARLRVEIGRLRAVLAPLARIEATARGFVLVPLQARRVVLLAPPLDGAEGALLALLADGAAWSSSALALALGASQRSVQRGLVALAAAGKVRATGRGRAQRWLSPPLTGITTILLLPAAGPLA